MEMCGEDGCRKKATTVVEFGNVSLRACPDHWAKAHAQAQDLKSRNDTIIIRSLTEKDQEENTKVAEAIDELFYQDPGPRKVGPPVFVKNPGRDPRRAYGR